MIVIIIGANRGIGAALANQLQTENQHTLIRTSRAFGSLKQTDTLNWTIHCDVTKEASIDAMKKQLEDQFPNLDWVINCAGILHTDQYMPEKSLDQITTHQMTQNFMTNAVGHLLVIKALQRLITVGTQALVCSVSARIGSIEDNHLGGWYAYRMSKAALNMGIKTTAIEWARLFPQVKFLLIHPGTTDTDLSAPFQNRLPTGQLQAATRTAKLLIKQLKSNQNHTSKHPLFIDYNGADIDW
ncbi:SDR family NAD(P)-dependent oxidoreductase [Marinicella litoralis]|uniref:NAD(P)-dependent dehydrogenase (Short-subunit alcohol dehydrogenase family) n=1 Tax=Marinicella litoralis TaxID=644220 RepID=A0A4R6XRT1_9GAMM|nr:SDR family NAD(P)-dependent oxidoreductase [Marinicella litoralis]TDR22615.1 NAD(P)-dependent dehydrogenase (short-subunit alcohol dehydrogenase family) [Marinicella litoralis]